VYTSDDNPNIQAATVRPVQRTTVPIETHRSSPHSGAAAYPAPGLRPAMSLGPSGPIACTVQPPASRRTHLLREKTHRTSAVFSYPIQIGILLLHFRTQESSGYPCDDVRSIKFGAPSERENIFFSLTLRPIFHVSYDKLIRRSDWLPTVHKWGASVNNLLAFLSGELLGKNQHFSTVVVNLTYESDNCKFEHNPSVGEVCQR